MVVAHGEGCRVNGGFKNLRGLCVLSEIANYNEARTFPDPMCCLDQPAIDHLPEAVPVSNPQSRLSVFPLVHGSRRRRIERSSPIPKRILEEKSSPGKQISTCKYFRRPKATWPTDGRLSFPVSQTSLSLGDLPRPARARAYMASIKVPQESPSLALSSRDTYSTSTKLSFRCIFARK